MSRKFQKHFETLKRKFAEIECYENVKLYCCGNLKSQIAARQEKCD